MMKSPKTSRSPAGNAMSLCEELQWSRGDYPRHMLSCAQLLSGETSPSNGISYLYIIPKSQTENPK